MRREHREGEGARLLGLDEMRAVFILGVVSGHALVPFLRVTPGLPWPAREPAGSWLVDIGAWWLYGTLVPTFFVISGYLLGTAMASQGACATLVRRAGQVAAALGASAVVVLPLTYAAFAAGWYEDGRCTFREIFQFRFRDPEIRDNLWGPAHLWFLEYLLLAVLVLLAWEALARRRGWRWPLQHDAPTSADGGAVPLRRGAARLAGVVGLAALAVAVSPSLRTRFVNSFVPDPGLVILTVVLLGAGAWLASRQGLVAALIRARHRVLLMSLGGFAATAWGTVRVFEGRGSAAAGAGLTVAVAVFVVCGALGWLAVGLSRRRSSRVLVRHVFPALWWIYLLHVPVLVLLQVAVHGAELPSAAKVALVVVASLAFVLATYRLVRPLIPADG